MQSMTGKNPSETIPGIVLIFFNTDREHAKFKLLAIGMSVNSNDHLWCDRTGLPKRFERLEKAEILEGVEKAGRQTRHRCQNF